MTLDDLKDHLDRRLDDQDRQRERLSAKVDSISEEVVKARIAAGKAEAQADAQEKSCAARHESNSKKIREVKGAIVATVGLILTSVWMVLWGGVTKKDG